MRYYASSNTSANGMTENSVQLTDDFHHLNTLTPQIIYLDKLDLNVREWTYPSCNSLKLGDQNAALNILAVGQTATAGESSSGK